jgi:hypothetical protein
LLLGFEQLLAIIFTFFTVNVWLEEEPAPAAPEAPTPVEEEPAPPAADGEVLVEPEALGMEPLLLGLVEELELAPLAEEPVNLT